MVFLNICMNMPFTWTVTQKCIEVQYVHIISTVYTIYEWQYTCTQWCKVHNTVIVACDGVPIIHYNHLITYNILYIRNISILYVRTSIHVAYVLYIPNIICTDCMLPLSTAE